MAVMLKLLVGLFAGLLLAVLAIPVLLAAQVFGRIARRRPAAAPQRRTSARGSTVIEAQGRVVEPAAQRD